MQLADELLFDLVLALHTLFDLASQLLSKAFDVDSLVLQGRTSSGEDQWQMRLHVGEAYALHDSDQIGE